MIKLFSIASIIFLSVNAYAQEIAPKEVKSNPTEELDLPITTAKFDKEIHDFGDIRTGSQSEVVFTITNTGDVPLVISKAKGSCSCTVPFFPQVPIMPGNSSEIHGVFKPKPSQKGNVTQRITVFGNFADGSMMIKIKANVIPSEDYEEEESFLVQAEQQEKDKEAIEDASPGCFVIFPNPTSNELQLDLKQYIGLAAVVNIHDESGRDILQESIPSISSTTTLFDVSGYSPGIYIISIVVDGKKPMSQCFVVSN